MFCPCNLVVDSVQDAGNIIFDNDTFHRDNSSVWFKPAIRRASKPCLGMGSGVIFHLVCWHCNGWNLLLFSCKFSCFIYLEPYNFLQLLITLVDMAGFKLLEFKIPFIAVKLSIVIFEVTCGWLCKFKLQNLEHYEFTIKYTYRGNTIRDSHKIY